MRHWYFTPTCIFFHNQWYFTDDKSTVYLVVILVYLILVVFMTEYIKNLKSWNNLCLQINENYAS